MPIDIVMPQLGLTMTEGSVARWFKHQGEKVEKGEPLYEVVTDKVNMEVEAPADGTLGKILIPVETVVPVGTVLAHLLGPGESEPVSAPTESSRAIQAVTASAPLPKGVAEMASAGPAAVGEAERAAPGKWRASPRARRAARQLGVDLSAVRGTGLEGRIVEEDVKRFASRPEAARAAAPGGRAEEPMAVPRPAVTAAGGVKLLTGVRKVMAERMAQSFRTAPHFYLTVEVDAGRLLELLEDLRPPVEKLRGVRLTVTDLLIKALALALAAHPEANVSWAAGDEGPALRPNTSIDIGVATALPEGLIVPVLRRADQLELGTLAAQRKDLVERAQGGHLTLQELESASCTLSNLGQYRVDQFQAIINPPQSMIVAVGRIKERPVAVKGTLLARPTMFWTLSADHRMLDGVTAARFLNTMVEIVEAPYRLLAPSR